MPEPHTHHHPPCRHVWHLVPAHAQLTQPTAVGAVCRAQCEPIDMVLLYAPVSATVLRYFACRDLGGVRYLAADPVLACDNARQRGPIGRLGGATAGHHGLL